VLGDRELAEDCTQDAFIKAFGSWSRWRPDAPAEAWLHRIALNAAISAKRRQKVRSVGEYIRRVGEPTPQPDPGSTESFDLMAALRSLPPKQAAAIVLRHFHGYSNREIALAIGTSERTIASRLAAAKERMQSRLRWLGDEDERIGHMARERLSQAESGGEVPSDVTSSPAEATGTGLKVAEGQERLPELTGREGISTVEG
jgi:RNA polymerase sigma-70 factor (ECF subfamily)